MVKEGVSWLLVSSRSCHRPSLFLKKQRWSKTRSCPLPLAEQHPVFKDIFSSYSKKYRNIAPALSNDRFLSSNTTPVERISSGKQDFFATCHRQRSMFSTKKHSLARIPLQAGSCLPL